jgi:hypothetical protein
VNNLMKFGSDIVTPSYTRTPTFNSLNGSGETYEFECSCCKSGVVIKLEHILGSEFKWRDVFDRETQKQIEKHFELNIVGKSPDGGWPGVRVYRCNDCLAEYLIYVGVSEVSNSVYRVTIQGITELIDE